MGMRVGLFQETFFVFVCSGWLIYALAVPGLVGNGWMFRWMWMIELIME